ncbi:hypothetical protein ILYODFUR_034673, partial [Ilyodon furcidens]
FHPDHFKIYLKHSRGKGPCFIFIARLNGPFCPFHAMFKFATERHKLFPTSLPLFLTPEGVPMTASWFLNHLRLILVHAVFPQVSSQVTLFESGWPLEPPH